MTALPAHTILFLCDYKAPYGGNFIASLCALGDALQARGCRCVYAFCAGAEDRDWYARMAADGRNVRCVPAGTRNALHALLGLIDENHADLLHVHFGLMLPARLAALLRPRLRLVLHNHSDFSLGRTVPLVKRVKRLGLRLLDRLLGRREVQIDVGQHMRTNNARRIHIPNALAPTRFVAHSIPREERRAQLSVTPAEVFVLLFAWSPSVKGADVAARAVRLLCEQGDTRFVLGIVYGRDCTADGMRQFLSETADIPADAPYLRLLPPTEDVFSYHRAADVMLSASRSEAFPYSVLEALSVGTPCVCSDIPGTRWAADYPTVRLFSSGDAADCARALSEAAALRDASDFPALAAQTAADVQSQYGIDRWIAAVIAAYGI